MLFLPQWIEEKKTQKYYDTVWDFWKMYMNMYM